MHTKPNLLLDLDQTLISAEPTEEYDQKKNKKKEKKFVHHNLDNYYIVFERPHLQEFLDYIFANYNVSVWTAASKDYALFIIDNIILTKPNRKLDYVFFSYHCKISSAMDTGTKKLTMLWDIYKLPNYNKDNTYILDDYNDVYKQEGAIRAKAFEFTKDGSENDDFLVKLIPNLEKLKDGKITTKEINKLLK